MGYMGFGMNKEVYTRKPKSSFSKIKEVYGDHAEKYHHAKEEKEKWSEKDKEEFRQFIASKLKQDAWEDVISKFITYLFVTAFVVLILYVVLNIIF